MYVCCKENYTQILCNIIYGNFLTFLECSHLNYFVVFNSCSIEILNVFL